MNDYITPSERLRDLTPDFLMLGVYGAGWLFVLSICVYQILK